MAMSSVWDSLQYSQQPMSKVWLAEFCPPITECFFWTYFLIAALHLMVKDTDVLKTEKILVDHTFISVRQVADHLRIRLS